MSNQAYNEFYGSRTDGAPMNAGDMQAASMLDQMRDRLASLSDEARSIRSQMPNELEPDVERIQQQMQRLGERLSDLSRGALVPYAASRASKEQRVKEVRYVTEDDIRVGRTTPDQIIALGAPGAGFGAMRRPEHRDMNDWDEPATAALMQLYESGEAYSYSRNEARAPQAARTAARAVASRIVERPLYAASSGGAMMGGQQAATRGCTMDEAALDRRFAEIAARIEEQLAQIQPEAALASLGSRFDQLESQINTMIGQMATRADLDELRLAEAQIDEIAGQLTQLRRQMARLDMIDAHLGTLTSQLSDDRLTRLFNEGVHISADIGRLDAIDSQLRMIAVQLSDERLSGLVSRSSSHEVDYEEIAYAAAQRVVTAGMPQAHQREIGEVRGMIESLINERRNNDENNASMLETMQQAIIRVLDRIDQLETHQPQMPATVAPAVPAATAAPAYGAPFQSYQPAAVPPAMPPLSQAASAEYEDLIPATATVFAQMSGAEPGEASDFLPPLEQEDEDADMQAYHEDAASEQLPPRQPVYTTSSFDLDEAFSRSRDVEAMSFGEPQPDRRSMEVLRHDFIADAHRAKLKAAAKPDASMDPDVRVGELSVGSREEAKPRRRSIFSFRSQRLAMSVLIVLAAIPAAIFFMPRTAPANIDDMAPAAITSQPEAIPHNSAPDSEPMDAAPTAPAPTMVPPLNAPSKQTMQDEIEPRLREYRDAIAEGAQIDTASLPDGVGIQDAPHTGAQLAQINEQVRMAQMSGQLGIAAAQATPASLMQEQVVGDATNNATDAPQLPPATVGPYSLRLAAVQGDASAQFEVASRLAEGKGTDQDLIEASQWYQRAAAQGFPMAQFRLGTLYERGIGVKPDSQRAQVWYERAAGQGNVKAMHNLAVLIASRPNADYKTAAGWFTAAADHGLSDSQFNLAILYENGMGVEKNAIEAYKWFVLAAKSGDKDSSARRDAMKAKLSAEQLAVAEVELEAWRSKPITGMANDARLAGQAWRDGKSRG
jgi:localization factor PodJL